MNSIRPEPFGSELKAELLMIEGSQPEGKAAPLERGRGKHSPPASPTRVTERAWERRDKMLPFGLLEIFWKIEMFQEFQ